MKSSEIKTIVILFLSILVLVLNSFIIHIFNQYGICAFILGLFFIFLYLNGFNKSKNRYRKDVMLTILIYSAIYYIVIYLLGLYFGFSYTIYSSKLTSIFKNIIPVLLIIVLSETLRYEINQKNKTNKIILALSLILFFMIDTTLIYYNIGLKSFNSIFITVSLSVLPMFSQNFLLTYLSVKTDYLTCILYRIIMQIPIFIVPIVPNFGNYIESVIKFVVPIFIFWKIYRLFLKVPMLDKIQKKEKKRGKGYLLLTVFLLIIVALTSDYFKYQLYVIATGSMVPNINRGDVVITKKLSDEEKKKLKVGEVLVFKKEDRIIVHRIYRIVKSGKNIFFETKGDHNNASDGYLIEIKDIIGTTQFKAAYVGYPTVMLNDLIHKK